jgi:hypothetical protein
MTDVTPDVLTAPEHVMAILRLKHPKPEKQLHPAVIGSAIYYLQKWTKINEAPPDKLAAKDNGNIAMAWEETQPPMAIEIQATNQSADILMQSADGVVTKKVNEEGTDAKALETVVNILTAVTTMAYATEETDNEQGSQEPIVAG